MVTSTSNPKPLLAESEDNASPARLGGPAQASEMEVSPLERLIAQSTSEQAAAATASPFFLEERRTNSESFQDTQEGFHSNAPAILGRTSATLIAGSLCLLQICLVWASFLSEAWFETHMTLNFGNTQTVGISSDQVLQRTTLASLLSAMLGSNQSWSAMVLVLTCLILPCLCMILCVSWTVGDYQEATGSTPRRTSGQRQYTHSEILGFSPRELAEYLFVRIPLLAFFLLAIMDVGTSSLAFQSSRTEVIITNRTKGGLVCYTLGTACALGVLVVLRMAATPIYRQSDILERQSSTVTSPLYQFEYSRQARPRAPPDQAFQELQQPLMAGSGEDPSTWTDTEGGGVSSNGQESERQDTNQDNEADAAEQPFWKKIAIYEIGLLAAALWIPALFLPLFQVSYDGLIAKFMEDGAANIYFYQLPFLLWEKGNAAGTDPWILVALGSVFLLLVYILPLLATIIGIAYWKSPPGSKTAWFYRVFLRFAMPCLGGVVFSISLFLALPSFQPLGDYILDSQTSGVCQKFENITTTSCLTILGDSRLGQWFLLAQSLVLEVFLLLTLSWKR